MDLRFTSEKDLQCKHCGFVKPRLDLYCYFLWEDGKWSDQRECAPNQAVPALVQYCPNCHRFYYIDAEAILIKNVNDYNWIEPVDYDVILPSIREYDNFDWSPVIEYNQRLMLMWAYNDKFYRSNSGDVPSEFDVKVAKWNLINLIQFYNDSIMICELLREAGLFEDCLKEAVDAMVDEQSKAVLDRIVTLAKQEDKRPFKIAD